MCIQSWWKRPEAGIRAHTHTTNRVNVLFCYENAMFHVIVRFEIGMSKSIPHNFMLLLFFFLSFFFVFYFDLTHSSVEFHLYIYRLLMLTHSPIKLEMIGFSRCVYNIRCVCVYVHVVPLRKKTQLNEQQQREKEREKGKRKFHALGCNKEHLCVFACISKQF